MTKDVCVALDMGNSGGKVLAAAMENGRLEILEERIIENRVVDVAGALYWDVFSIFRDLKAALRDFSRLGTVRTIGVDSTSGCYAFVKRNGHLCAPPAFGRDLRYQNWERVIQKRRASIRSAAITSASSPATPKAAILNHGRTMCFCPSPR